MTTEWHFSPKDPRRGWDSWKLLHDGNLVATIVHREHDLGPQLVGTGDADAYERYWKDWGIWRVHFYGSHADYEDFPLTMPLEDVQAVALASWRMR